MDHFSKDEKLEIINSMNFVDSDGDGECLYYVFVSDNEDSREKLSKIVYDVDGFINQYASNNDINDCEPCYFDIQMAAWNCTDADYFDGKKFIVLGEKEVQKRIEKAINY